MYLPNIVITLILLRIPPIQRLRLIHIRKLSSLLQLLLLSELFKQLLIFDLDILVLLLQLLVLEGHPLVLHVEAHHLRLQLSQPLLQHGRVVRVEVRVLGGLGEAGVREHTATTGGLLWLLLIYVVLELKVTVGVTGGVV
jgi:hypothetical protein